MTEQEFLGNFADQFDDTPLSAFAMDTDFRSLEEWSSFIALSVMAMVKTEYDVALTADEMRNANTPQDIYDIITSRVG